jgi:competence protein ComEC
MVPWVVIAASLLVISVAGFVESPEQKVVFLDVGQGDAILVQDGTRQVLIDGGRGMAVLERLGEELPWFDRRIEVVIATHPDQDHLEGLLHVLERYEVGLVLLPRMPHTSQLQESWLERLQTLLAQQAVQYRFAWAGQQVRMGDDLRLEILGPFSLDGEILAPGRKTNNAAVLTRVDYAGLSFLLTSDAEAAIERRLVAEKRDLLDVAVLKAGHHGSRTSTTPELLAAASPDTVVVSVGKDNPYGHPHPDVMARLENMHRWRTDEQGSVRFVHRGEEWLVSAHPRR